MLCTRRPDAAPYAVIFLDTWYLRSYTYWRAHCRWRVLPSHIRTQLNPFIGKSQISLICQDRWQEYPIWRQKNGKGRSRPPPRSEDERRPGQPESDEHREKPSVRVSAHPEHADRASVNAGIGDRV